MTLEVQRDRPQQRTDLDIVLLPAEGHFEVQNDRQQQPDSVFVKQRDKGHLHVLSNRQKTTIAHPVERHFQVHNCNSTSQQIPKGI